LSAVDRTATGSGEDMWRLGGEEILVAGAFIPILV
jgi:hypothetical protein